MEIKNLLTGLDPYQQQAKVEKNEAEAKARSAKTADTRGGDKVSLSPEARLRTEAYKSAQAAPDVRQEKVDAIKAKIANGEYQIDTRKIAEKMLSEEVDLFS
ncbi:MAG: flagellar biosynthesis anti-sigma factor FlgM [Desulfovibrionaceae bacterium]